MERVSRSERTESVDDTSDQVRLSLYREKNRVCAHQYDDGDLFHDGGTDGDR